MEILKQIQKILDDTLIPKRILSHYRRRLKVNKIKGGGVPRDDIYITYRIVTNGNRVHGNGGRVLGRTSFDINTYYKDAESMKASLEAAGIVDEITAAFKAAGWFIVNDKTDLYDNLDGYLGFNIEVALVGV